MDFAFERQGGGQFPFRVPYNEVLEGSVHQVKADQLQQLLAAQPSYKGSLHFIYP